MATETKTRETKAQVWTKVQEEVLALLESSKVSKKFEQSLMDMLEGHIAPKSGGSNISNPPKEIDGVMNYYCRFHGQYEPQENMVMSKDKSKGYCKASISLWNKTNSDIKKINNSVSDLMAEGNFEEAQAKAIEAKELKATFNSPEFYDYDRDWAKFTKVSTKPEEVSTETTEEV